MKRINIYKAKWTLIAGVLVLLFQNSLHSQNIETAGSAAAKSDTAALYNNLANIYFMESGTQPAKLDTAILFYRNAYQRDKTDAGILLNMALAFLVKNDTLLADSLFEQALTMLDTSAQKAAYLLKINLQEEAEYGTAKIITTEEIKYQLKKAESKKKKKKKRKKVPTRRGRIKSIQPSDLQKHLYFKK